MAVSAVDGEGPMRALVLAYYFPPVGGAGVQRTLKFTRYLPELGVEPVVVTGPYDSLGDQSLTDQTLAAQLPDGIQVIRVAGPEPVPSGRWRRRAERWARLERPWSRWWVDGAVAAARRAPAVNVVLATMSPFDSAEAARRIAAERGVPWVADLRDPWALDEMFAYPSRAHRAREARTMREVLSTAAAVVMNTPEAARAARTLLGPGGPPVHSVTNGYDSADFAQPSGPVENEAFRIVHTGELHTALGREHRRSRRLRRLLGGELGGVDILPRSHVYLLRAMERVAAADPALGARLELQLAGPVSAEDRAVSDASPVTVRELGYLTHPETIALIRRADMLFLPMHDVAPGFRSRIVPGKAYEYLAAGRPILAAVPEGDARDFLVAAGGAYICDPTDVEALATAIRACAHSGPGELATETRRAAIAPSERRELTAALAAVLRDAAGRHALVAGR